MKNITMMLDFIIYRLNYSRYRETSYHQSKNEKNRSLA